MMYPVGPEYQQQKEPDGANVLLYKMYAGYLSVIIKLPEACLTN